MLILHWSFDVKFFPRARNVSGSYEKRALVVQKVDSAKPRDKCLSSKKFNRFPNTYPLDSDLSGPSCLKSGYRYLLDRINLYPVDYAIRFPNTYPLDSHFILWIVLSNDWTTGASLFFRYSNFDYQICPTNQPSAAKMKTWRCLWCFSDVIVVFCSHVCTTVVHINGVKLPLSNFKVCGL